MTLDILWQLRFQALWSINNDDDSDSLDDSVSDPEIVIEIPAKKMRTDRDEKSETSTENEESSIERRASVDKPAAKPAVMDDYRPPDDVDDVS